MKLNSHVLSVRRQLGSSRPESKYDDSTGLVFDEQVIHAASARNDWIWQPRRPQLGFTNRPLVGPLRLRDLAIHTACLHSRGLEPQLFDHFPWQVAQQLWRSILATGCDSFHVWRVFALAYPEQVKAKEDKLGHREHVVSYPRGSLWSYLKPIDPPELQFITFLTLSHLTFSRADLLALSELRNLGVLVIAEEVKAPDASVDDGVLRAWSRRAQDMSGFPNLRVLYCRFDTSIFASMFDYISAFPALSTFAFDSLVAEYGDELKDHAFEHGWVRVTTKTLSKVLSEEPKSEMSNGSLGQQMQLFFGLQAGASWSESGTLVRDEVDELHGLPSLHLDLGACAPWGRIGSELQKRVQVYRRDLSVPRYGEAEMKPERPTALTDELKVKKRPLPPKTGYGKDRKRPGCEIINGSPAKHAIRPSKQQDGEITLSQFQESF